MRKHSQPTIWVYLVVTLSIFASLFFSSTFARSRTVFGSMLGSSVFHDSYALLRLSVNYTAPNDGNGIFNSSYTDYPAYFLLSFPGTFTEQTRSYIQVTPSPPCNSESCIETFAQDVGIAQAFDIEPSTESFTGFLEYRHAFDPYLNDEFSPRPAQSLNVFVYIPLQNFTSFSPSNSTEDWSLGFIAYDAVTTDSYICASSVQVPSRSEADVNQYIRFRSLSNNEFSFDVGSIGTFSAPSQLQIEFWNPIPHQLFSVSLVELCSFTTSSYIEKRFWSVNVWNNTYPRFGFTVLIAGWEGDKMPERLTISCPANIIYQFTHPSYNSTAIVSSFNYNLKTELNMLLDRTIAQPQSQPMIQVRHATDQDDDSKYIRAQYIGVDVQPEDSDTVSTFSTSSVSSKSFTSTDDFLHAMVNNDFATSIDNTPTVFFSEMSSATISDSVVDASSRLGPMDQESSSLSTTDFILIIVFSVIGALLLLTILICICVCCKSNSRRKRPRAPSQSKNTQMTVITAAAASPIDMASYNTNQPQYIQTQDLSQQPYSSQQYSPQQQYSPSHELPQPQGNPPQPQSDPPQPYSNPNHYQGKTLDEDVPPSYIY